MANPQRVPDPRLDDPFTPPPPTGGPLNERLTPNPDDPRIDNRTIVAERRSGSGVLIAVVVLVLAVIAYFLFAPGGQNTPVPADQPAATTEPAAPEPSSSAPASPADQTQPAPDATAPATPAPDATAPAAPADQMQPAPDATAPATPVPDATAPAAPESSTPTEPAPTAPAPAAPAQ
jgi:hypothetical protein